MEKVNLSQLMVRLTESPAAREVAALNGMALTLIRFRGALDWRRHEEHESLIHVLSGSLRVESANRTLAVRAGETAVVPRGLEYRPAADREVQIWILAPRYAGDNARTGPLSKHDSGPEI